MKNSSKYSSKTIPETYAVFLLSSSVSIPVCAAQYRPYNRNATRGACSLIQDTQQLSYACPTRDVHPQHMQHLEKFR